MSFPIFQTIKMEDPKADYSRHFITFMFPPVAAFGGLPPRRTTCSNYTIYFSAPFERHRSSRLESALLVLPYIIFMCIVVVVVSPALQEGGDE